MLERKTERIGRTPPPIVIKVQKDESELSKKDKKALREDKKRKKEQQIRNKSRERKKRKDKKHKKDRPSERRSKHAGKSSSKDKSVDREKDSSSSVPKGPTILSSSAIATIDKKSRRNPKLVSDRKRSIDEANFEPDYSASDSDSEPKAPKRGKIDDEIIDVDAMPTPKKKRKVRFALKILLNLSGVKNK